MKCPKCGYLGFEDADRCRNCGYDFSLGRAVELPELSIRPAGRDDIAPLDDLAFESKVASRQATPELPLFGAEPAVDDQPLITKPSPPRAPLAVRRATPEIPRLKPEPRPAAPMLDLAADEAELDPLRSLTARPTRDISPASQTDESGLPAAGIGARFLAAAIDVAVLAAVDLAVVYFTLQICGLTVDEFAIVPKVPLVAFLIVLNGGYFVAFTAGGQTLGKMATGIRVVPNEPSGSVDLPHSIVRTAIWTILAIPAGLGLLTALLTRDRRALHDRCAGTRVVRATA
ncbi:MAG TPA: RDD family protein [Vicinamibacterales bacterium]|jgi:uncharacterized RDD family membrane protein YckC